MNDNKKVMAVLGTTAVIFFILVFTVISSFSKKSKNQSENDDGYGDATEVTAEAFANDDEARTKLNSMLGSINCTETQAEKVPVELGSTSLADELPDIDETPLTVTGDGQINIEIFTSTEKGGTGTDGWLNEVAKKFNAAGYTVNGQSVSVSVRSIASGLAYDYIVSGKYLPQAYTPSNELWGKMIENEGVAINMTEKRLVENVAGILLSQEEYDNIKAKYGEVNVKTVTQATADNEIIMGYTNPFASSTGINFLISTLSAYDSENPLSDAAKDGFNAFQANVPFVAYTTLQMRDAVSSGSLSGLILEQQLVANSDDLSDYVFTPFGVRHDNPMYSIGTLTDDQQAVLDMFDEYCLSAESQQLATEYGFNSMDDYQSEVPDYSGSQLISAQKLWKENKDVAKPITAVFVADVSGSMDGEPLNQLKDSLINASQYINDTNSIGLVCYGSDVEIKLPIAPFDLNQRSYFAGAVESMYAYGGTASFDAVLVAMNMLLEAKDENPNSKMMIFLLSDGETNTGYTLEEIRGILEYYGIAVYTIGYNADIEALESISSINEGTSINADSDDVIYKLKNLFNAQM